ncbi:MAG: dockerin type I repeat-containing protein, partial [Oscillospiraceae bacterium]|nr:dockerin type I repeat-containing protein [Oscillospiraceae bacterium]
PMWESMYREPDVKGNYAAEDTFTETGSFFTDEQYADYLTEWHGEKHLVLTSVEGTRYVVFTAAYEYPSFFPEHYLNDFGDLNHDGIHNASDAAMILVQAAMAGAQDATFLDPRMVEAKINGDLDGDGFSNASDAALLLIYAAYYGAQREAPADLQSYLYELNDTVKRVTIGYREGLSSEHVTKELLTSPAELETYFTETVTPQNINMTDCLAHRDSAEVLAELMAAYPAAFFETHNLAVFCADEANQNNRQEVRQIETSDGGVTITMHHLDINGEPVEGFYAVLVAVDKRITDVSQITVNETHSRYTGSYKSP